MNQGKWIRRAAMALAVCLLLGAAGGLAEAGTRDDAAMLEALRAVKDFKFQNHHTGIGTGHYAVYTAPSENAFRSGNGKTAINLDAEMGESGVYHGWMLVRYKTDRGQVRVGYIRAEGIDGFKSGMHAMDGEPILLTAAADIPVTDGPMDLPEYFGTIRAGETFGVLRKYTYTGSWWYVECTIEGKPARGFIDRNTAQFCLGAGADPAAETVYTLETLGYPEVSPRGTGRIGHFEVSEEPRKAVRVAPGDTDHVTVAYPGRYYACYDQAETEDGKTWYYIWVEEDSKWGWIAGANGRLVPD